MAADPTLAPVPSYEGEGKQNESHWQHSTVKTNKTKQTKRFKNNCLQEIKTNKLTDHGSKVTWWEGFIARSVFPCGFGLSRMRDIWLFGTQPTDRQPLVEQLQVNRDLQVSVDEQMMEFKKDRTGLSALRKRVMKTHLSKQIRSIFSQCWSWSFTKISPPLWISQEKDEEEEAELSPLNWRSSNL